MSKNNLSGQMPEKELKKKIWYSNKESITCDFILSRQVFA